MKFTDLPRWLRVAARVSGLLALGTALLSVDGSVAQATGIPALAPILLSAGWLFIAAGFSHLARVILFPRLNLIVIAEEGITKRNPAAGLVFLGICIVLAALLTSQARAQSREHLLVLVAEQRAHWPDAPLPWTMAGQVEAESAWRQKAELRTAREHGAGFAQLTRAYNADGSLRFDRLADARRLHPSLAGWTWDDRFAADKQLRALVLMDRAEWASIAGATADDDRWAMTLSAYNGGRGGLARDRALCRGVAGCDDGRWFGHVELHSWRAKVAVSGYGRSFFQINRDYVRSILRERRGRYVWGWQ
jgi:hypothetical protein